MGKPTPTTKQQRKNERGLAGDALRLVGDVVGSVVPGVSRAGHALGRIADSYDERTYANAPRNSGRSTKRSIMGNSTQALGGPRASVAGVAAVGSQSRSVTTGNSSALMRSPLRREYLADLPPVITPEGQLVHVMDISPVAMGDWMRNLAIDFETCSAVRLQVDYVPYNSLQNTGYLVMGFQPDPAKQLPESKNEMADLQGAVTSSIREAATVRMVPMSTGTLGTRRYVGGSGYLASDVIDTDIAGDGGSITRLEISGDTLRQEVFATFYAWIGGCDQEASETGSLFVTYQFEFYTPVPASQLMIPLWNTFTENYGSNEINTFTTGFFDTTLTQYRGSDDWFVYAESDPEVSGVTPKGFSMIVQSQKDAYFNFDISGAPDFGAVTFTPPLMDIQVPNGIFLEYSWQIEGQGVSNVVTSLPPAVYTASGFTHLLYSCKLRVDRNTSLLNPLVIGCRINFRTSGTAASEPLWSAVTSAVLRIMQNPYDETANL